MRPHSPTLRPMINDHEARQVGHNVDIGNEAAHLPWLAGIIQLLQHELYGVTVDKVFGRSLDFHVGLKPLPLPLL